MFGKKEKSEEKNLYILNNLDKDTELKLTFKLQDKEFEFPVTIIDKHENFIFINPIKINEKILSFTNTKIRVDLILPFEDERPIVWENVNIQTFFHPKKKISTYVVESKLGKSYNRRGNFRIPLSIIADAQMGHHNLVEKVSVHDISSTGISVVTHKKYSCKKGDEMHIVFQDSLVGRKINVSAIIVREQTLKNGDFLYGCKFKEESEDIRRYIQERQRKDLQRMSGKLK